MTGGLPDERLARILDGIETIERSIGVLAEKRKTTSRSSYRTD